jgi:Na+(H+)/acetate symporter ActP
MKQNMGKTDRVLRTVLAVIVAVLYFSKQLTGLAAIVLGLFALVFLVTSLLGFCPLYVPLGISSRRKTDG